MAKYDPLARFLAASVVDQFVLNYDQIKQPLGEELPPNARDRALRGTW